MITGPSGLRLALAKRKGRRLSRFPKLKHPLAAERNYRKQLKAFVKTFSDLVHHRLIPRLPDLADQYYAARPDLSRKDASEQDLATIIENIRVSFAAVYTDEEIAAMARAQGISVQAFNRRVIEENFKKVLGLDILSSEPWLAQEIELFTIANSNLISSLRENALGKMQSEVYESFRAGLRWEELAANITELVDPDDGFFANKADLIARDQTAKLNGQLNELRQTELGVPKYIWRTSLDERVRETHRRKEGKVFSWDDPPPDTGHPGEDYNCRCTAEPYLEEMLNDKLFRSNEPVFPTDE